MTGAAPLAGLAAALAVAGAWELLAAVERTALVSAAERAVRSLRDAGRGDHEPSDPERRRLAVLATAVLGCGGWLAGGAALGAATAVTAPAAVAALLRARRRRWRAALADGAPDAARALADALAAGRSVRAAVVEAAAGTSGAAGTELRRAAAVLRFGEPTGQVVEALRRRAGSPAWDTIVAALLLHRDAGGDLAGLLRELAAGLEAAGRARREAEGATAQTRYSARIVLAMPLGAALLAEAASPGFAAGLLRSPIAAVLVACAAALQLAAALLLRHLARVRT